MPLALAAAVITLMRDVSDKEIMPRWRNLGADDSREKAPGDWVTVADLAAEVALRDGLSAILPGIATVGEEEAAADPSVMSRLGGDVWIIDPVDGTKHFRNGDDGFGVIVSLLRGGQPVGGWILDCVSGRAAWTYDVTAVHLEPGKASLGLSSGDGTGVVSWHFHDAAKTWLDPDGVAHPPGLPPARRAVSSSMEY